MRHRKKVFKLGRTASHRRATLRNLAIALFENHQVKTTLAKAKAARSFVERLITYGKKNTVHARRLAFRHLQSRTLVKKLFDEIAPTYTDRPGGYTRIIKLGQRSGDGASMAILQLVGFEELILEKKQKARKKAKPSEEVKEEKKAAEKEPPPGKEKAEVASASEEKAKKAAKKEKASKETKDSADTKKKSKPSTPKAEGAAESVESPAESPSSKAAAEPKKADQKKSKSKDKSKQ